MHNGMPATQFNNLVARGSAHCQSTEIYPQILRKSRKFRIANRLVTVETRSVSLGNGDNGDAEIIVSSGVKSTKLTSQFSDDMWTFIRPAYISWEDVDNHPGRDLLIWKPSLSTHGPLHAKEYISSEDGELHVLQVPLETPIPRH